MILNVNNAYIPTFGYSIAHYFAFISTIAYRQVSRQQLSSEFCKYPMIQVNEELLLK